MLKRYRVALHAHASAEVFVEASSASEANRLAQEEVKAGRARVRPIRNWTPVATSDLSRER
jgi:hypothetical protein